MHFLHIIHDTMTDSSTISLHNEVYKETRENHRYPYRSHAHESSREDREESIQEEEEEDTQSTRQESKWSQIPGTEIGNNDILLGRGIGKSHHGNLEFRGLIRKYKLRYLAAPKAQKPRVAEEVVKVWRALKPAGRFLARKSDSSLKDGDLRKAIWYDVGDKRAREKASMSLRERTAEVLPFLKYLREEQERTHHLTSQVFRPFEYSFDHDPPPIHPDWYRGRGPTLASSAPQEERLPYVLPPPLPRHFTDKSSHPPLSFERALPPPPAAEQTMRPEMAWKDYSGGRNHCPIGQNHSNNGTCEYSTVRPSVGEGISLVEESIHRVHSTSLEVQQQTTIHRLQRHMQEQRKLIEKLKTKLSQAPMDTPHCSGIKTEVTPYSSELIEPLPPATQVNPGSNLILSPVPYSSENEQHDEDEVGLENYQTILLDCLRTEDVPRTRNKAGWCWNKSSNTEDQDSSEILRLTPVQPRVVDGKRKAIPCDHPIFTNTTVVKKEDEAFAYATPCGRFIQPLRHSVAWGNKKASDPEETGDSSKKREVDEETLSSSDRLLDIQDISTDVVKSSMNSTPRSRPISTPRANVLSSASTNRGVKRTLSSMLSLGNSGSSRGEPLLELLDAEKSLHVIASGAKSTVTSV